VQLCSFLSNTTSIHISANESSTVSSFPVAALVFASGSSSFFSKMRRKSRLINCIKESQSSVNRACSTTRSERAVLRDFQLSNRKIKCTTMSLSFSLKRDEIKKNTDHRPLPQQRCCVVLFVDCDGLQRLPHSSNSIKL